MLSNGKKTLRLVEEESHQLAALQMQP